MDSIQRRSSEPCEGRSLRQPLEGAEAGIWADREANMRTSPAQHKRMPSATHNTSRKRSMDERCSGAHRSHSQSPSTNINAPPNTPFPVSTTIRQRTRSLQQPHERYDGHHVTIMLPHWQPDTEVDECPVCETRFSWLFRRHHCRKCGRVVCANCSQHRITIPRKYIVQPPEHIQVNPVGMTDGSLLFMNPADVVRVCNPCVPDPNLNPPPQVPDSGILGGSRQGIAQQSPAVSNHFPGQSSSFGRSTPLNNLQDLPLPARSIHQVLHPLPEISQLPRVHTGPHSSRQYQGRRSTLPGSSAALHPSSFNTNRTVHVRGQSIPGHLLAQGNSMRTARRRQQIAEEDECPVCSCELPPRDASNDDAARAQHVAYCINSYGSHPARPAMVLHRVTNTYRGLTDQESRSSRSVSHTSAIDNSQLSPEANVSSEASQSMHSTLFLGSSSERIRCLNRAPRMLEYKGTGQDCSDDQGEPQECIICFEEFKIGDDMARLECLCKFHKVCILGWWQAKIAHSGANLEIGCPTHVLHV